MKLEVKGLDKSFGTHKILSHINLKIPNQAIALIGPSGSGKSTLLKILAGLECPDKGSVIMDNEEMVFEEKALRQHRLKVGIVFQSWNLFPHLTALNNISLPLHCVHGYSKQEAEALSFDLLKRFDMASSSNKKPSQLSGGQNQRVAIIRAIAKRPKILLFDEPTSALDPLMTSEVLDLITELKQEGSVFVIATHHLSFAQKISDWTVFLSGGKVIESNQTSLLFKNPQNAEVKFYFDQVLKY